ncbi:MAG: hypothetical protein AAF667_14835 [Pseudomonadota bacterium]
MISAATALAACAPTGPTEQELAFQNTQATLGTETFFNTCVATAPTYRGIESGATRSALTKRGTIWASNGNLISLSVSPAERRCQVLVVGPTNEKLTATIFQKGLQSSPTLPSLGVMTRRNAQTGETQQFAAYELTAPRGKLAVGVLPVDEFVNLIIAIPQ